MAMSSKALLPLLCVAALGLGACETIHPSGSADPAFGEAVKHNMAIQTIDPDPVYSPEDAQPGAHGAKGSAAVKRYRTDQVKDVEQIVTSTSGEGGSR
jgi:hypothetical protein